MSAPRSASAALRASLTPSVKITSESPGSSCRRRFANSAFVTTPRSRSLSVISVTESFCSQSGGVWPAFTYSTSPVFVSSRPRKSVTNFDCGRFSLSATLSCVTSDAGSGSLFEKMRNATCRPAIISPAVTPLPLTSPMTK
jgi:hypothetical protein